MTAMDDLSAAKTAVRDQLLKNATGSRQTERVDQLLDDYQHALRRVHVQRLATKIRTIADTRGYNTALAYRRVAALIEETETR